MWEEAEAVSLGSMNNARYGMNANNVRSGNYGNLNNGMNAKRGYCARSD
jgi:hypothetical protein